MSYTYEFSRPAVTVDLVAFRIHDDALEVYLIRRPEPPFKGHWTLPGGFVHENEALEATALRILSDKTEIGDVYLEQLATFGAPDRDPRDRTISVAYFAILADGDAAGTDGDWFAADAPPELGFDHTSILTVAVQRLRAKLTYSDLGLAFMPETFTLTELQRSFEAVLGQALDKRNFRKSILSSGRVEATGEKSTGGAHPPAMLYRRADGT